MEKSTSLDNLNSNQLEAVLHTKTPLLIIAGPGTGKTRTLISKICYFLKTKLSASEEILALTFTEKASAEMRSRVLEQINKSTLPQIKTFHALAYNLLKQQNPQIISFEKQQQIFQDLLALSKFKDIKDFYALKEITNLVSLTKTSINSSESYWQDFVQEYNSRLETQKLLDFDDLLIKAVDLLEGKNSENPKFKHIFIDEFQDTTPLQFKLAQLLLSKNGLIYAIGDPLQSIYSFRGADSSIFELFNQTFPKTKTITLTDNYRNCAEVLTCAQTLFPNSYQLKPQNKNSGFVKLINTTNEFSEARFIVRTISELIGGGDLNQAGELQHLAHKNNKFSDFAVIYRTHHLARTTAKTMRESGFPFQIVGGGSIYERAEIDFIIKWFKFLSENNSESFLPLISHKFYQLPKKLLSELTLDQSTNWKDLLINLQSKRDRTTKQKHALDTIVSLSKLFQENENQDLQKMAETILQSFNLDNDTEEKTDKIQDLQEFLGSLLRFQKSDNPLAKFLEFYQELVNNDFYDAQGDRITLLTMHAAKGLEFKYVFIIGFEEGLIPFIRSSSKSSEKDQNSEEEKRLFYVALTRAEQSIWLLNTKERFKKSCNLSTFAEILSDTIKNETDTEVAKIEKRRAKLKAKRSQMKLLDF